jgi:hypothetical protein
MDTTRITAIAAARRRRPTRSAARRMARLHGMSATGTGKSRPHAKSGAAEKLLGQLDAVRTSGRAAKSRRRVG